MNGANSFVPVAMADFGALPIAWAGRARPVTAVVAVLVGILCIVEYANYRAMVTKYEYFVDNTAQMPLTVNLNMEVAMPCDRTPPERPGRAPWPLLTYL